jgi:hypothetical protein
MRGLYRSRAVVSLVNVLRDDVLYMYDVDEMKVKDRWEVLLCAALLSPFALGGYLELGFYFPGLPDPNRNSDQIKFNRKLLLNIPCECNLISNFHNPPPGIHPNPVKQRLK